METWIHAFSVPHRLARLAQRAERWGFAGLLVADSQNLAAEPELLDESNERFAAEVLPAL